MADKLGAKLAEFALLSDERNKLVRKRGVNLSTSPGLQEAIDASEAELKKISNWIAKHMDSTLQPKHEELCRGLDEARAEVAEAASALDAANAAKVKADERIMASWQMLKQASRYCGRRLPPRYGRKIQAKKGQRKS